MNNCVCKLKKSTGIFYEDLLCETHVSDDKQYTAQINLDFDGEQKELRGWLYLKKNEFEDVFDIATDGIAINYCPFCGRKL